MILSLFIRENEFHISNGNVDRIYAVEERCRLADMIPRALTDYLSDIDFNLINTLIYSNGPDTFTTLRIMASLIKGISIVRSDIRLISMSNFLTYIYKASEYSLTGSIAIPTQRGDYFVCDYTREGESEVQIHNTLNPSVLLHTSQIFKNINLAQTQYEYYISSDAKTDIRGEFASTEIRYGIDPIYKY